MRPVRVRPAEPADRAAVDALHDREWGGPEVVVHGDRYDLRVLPTLVAVATGRVEGALVWHVAGDSLEVVSLVARQPGGGAGLALLRAAATVGRDRRLGRLWLVTTNDNLPALRFYQRRGLRIVEVRPGAVDLARRLKPNIPTVGLDGIPLHDELVLEQRLDGGR
ncbi:GNAT family N-acetyltransferase [Micromonospora zhanjiangensis]|uniref:GNAT family N-acetyltransferase n=1 Tax=Micromonospora zhanjiangensis TaxID=1522057 RepID=A0ABV8KGK6_9ACTN